MSDWTSAAHPGILTTELPGQNTGPVQAAPWNGLVPFSILGAGDLVGDAAATIFNDWVSAKAADPGTYWFDHVHYDPKLLELGNIVSTVVYDVTIYNAYKEEERELSLAEANAGGGINFDDLPSLPFILGTQTGLTLSLTVEIEGPPTIDGTLDFETDVLEFSIPITGSRVTMFLYLPEAPIEELLQWKTDIIKNRYGEEQRISIRKNPRQILKYDLRMEIDEDRRKMMSLLFGWHARVFGVPVWHEARRLSQAATAGELSVIANTRWADFRVGSLAIVWESPSSFDALQIDSITESELTFVSALSNNYSRRAYLIPLRTAYADPTIQLNRWPNNLEDFSILFTVLDNDANLGSTDGWSTHNSKVMVDDANLARGTVPDNLVIEVSRLDNEVAPILQYTDWLTSRTSSLKTWYCPNAESTWKVRQLLHALRGSHTTFYLPTFFEDLVMVSPASSASQLLDIANVNYTDYIAARDPNASIRIEFEDGSVITRSITSSEVISNEVERLTVDEPWDSSFAVEDVRRISFLRRCRLANDQVKLSHQVAGKTTIETEVIGVQQ
jgi:hypothetical protein